MAEYTFFFNPMSRAQIARLALHEANADYEPVFVDGADKPQALLDAHTMAKLPTIVHPYSGHEHPDSEAAAVCHELAKRSAPEILTSEHEKADYFRWLFFAAGPLEQAVTNMVYGWNPDEKQEIAVGFGNYDKTIDALEGWFASHDYVCGARFTMA